jgi:hypothetical protein
MNDLRRLAQAVQHEIPDARLDLDEPERSQQAGWLDIRHEGLSVAVEWRPGIGFGVSLIEQDPGDPSKGLFEGPDHVFEDWHEAKDQILFLLNASSQPAQRRHSVRR